MRRPLHVYAVPELATYEASQTAPDEAGGRPVTGRDLSRAHDRIEFWLALRARELVA
jgi:hypothetical protein